MKKVQLTNEGKLLWGLYECTLGMDGSSSSSYGGNTAMIKLSSKGHDFIGKNLAHESGHALFSIRYPVATINRYAENPDVVNDGHAGGNPSGLMAEAYEKIYEKNRKESKK